MFIQNTQKKILVNKSIQKITSFEYLFVLILIIYAARSNAFVVESSIKENPIGFLVPVGLSIILALRWKVIFDLRFYSLIIGLCIYFLAITMKHHQIHVTIFLNYFALFFVVYLTIKSLKFNLFKIYEKLLYYLAIVGLVLWLIQFVLGGDSLLNLFSKIPGISSFSYVTGGGLNALFYSIQPLSHNFFNNFGSSIPRNCGFAWEPGAFGSFLCLAIFINLFIANTEKKSKIRLWILIAALVTTQSTTTFVIFVTIIFFFYANKKLNLIFLALPVVLAITIYIFNLPFMSSKIVRLVNETNNMEEIVRNSIGREERANPQRFVSFMIAYKDFLNNPILGIGGGQDESWTTKAGANISVISGIGNLLAQTGLVGFLFFIILTYKSSVFLSVRYNYKGKSLLFIILIFISISYTIILLPLLMCFWMFSFFEPHKSLVKKSLYVNFSV